MWLLVQADLQEHGVDLGDEKLLARRDWPWLRARVVGLLYRADTRVFRALAPTEPTDQTTREG